MLSNFTQAKVEEFEKEFGEYITKAYPNPEGLQRSMKSFLTTAIREAAEAVVRETGLKKKEGEDMPKYLRYNLALTEKTAKEEEWINN